MSKPKILVLGGGFAGLESAFYLRMKLGEKADISLVSDSDRFLFKPNTIYIPFGLDPEKLMIGLQKPTRRKDIEFVQARVREVDPEAKVVRADGQTLGYDFLVIATGATMRPDEVVGLSEFANTIWTPEEMLALREAYNALLSDLSDGLTREVLFLVPPNNKCAGPLYEMVMMLDTWLRRNHVRENARITWATYENSYIQAFGPRLHEVVTAEFERRGITGHVKRVVESVEKGGVRFMDGETLPYDLLVSFPPYAASTPFPSLPSDARGFIATELATRQVVGYPEVYAAGDAGDFPVKQAFLAFLQGDAVADHISAQVLGTKPCNPFLPVSMCVMEQYDKATFAQVPLHLTGDPARPVEVLPEDYGLYKVGSGPAWRLGKKMLGLYLPWRFGAGEPFHAGLPWKGMEFGLKAMSGVLAK